MRAPETGMARRSNFLVVTLLVMVAVLIGAVLLWNGGGEPANPTPDPEARDSAAKIDRAGELVARDGTSDRTEENRTAELDPATRSSIPTASPPTESTRERLTGRLVDDGGQPRAGVPVRWEPSEGGIVVRRPRTREERGDIEVATDSQGRFEIVTDLAHGGAIALDRRSGIVFASHGARLLGVEPQEADFDLGDLKAVAGWAVRGRVVDEQGVGVPSATLRVSERGDPIGFVWTDVLAVDGEGRFEILGLERRDIVVSAFANGFVPERSRVEYVDGAESPLIEIRMRHGAAIAGIVTDDLGRPIEGARIGLLRRERMEGGIEVEQIHGRESVMTDERGAFVVSGIDGQTASIRVSKNGYAPESMASVAVGRNDLLIQLPRLAVISGVLTDFSGSPLSGSDVRVRSAGEIHGPSGEGLEFDTVAGMVRRGHATTDEQGKFVLEDVRPGTVVLAANGDGHLATVSAPMQALPGATIEHVKLIAETGASLDVQVVDAKGRAVVDAQVAVSEASRDEAQEAMPGVRRMARSFRAREGNGSGRRDVMIEGVGLSLRTGRTDAEGHVILSGLPAGAVTVSATHPAHAPSRSIETVLPQRGRVEAIATMREAGFAAVEVVDGSGAPVVGITVLLRGPSGDDSEDHSARTDSDGKHRIGPLLPGRYDAVLELPPVPTSIGGMQIVLDRNGGEIEASRRSLEVRAGETANVRLIRPVLTKLHGVVSDASGIVVGAEVRLNRAGDELAPLVGGRSSTSDAEGRFEFTNLPAGQWELQWRRRGRPVFARMTLDIAPDLADLRQDLTIGGANVRVRVVAAADQLPLSRARVRLVPADGEGRARQAAPRARFAMVAVTREGNDDGDDSTQQMTINGDAEPMRTDDDGLVVFTEVPYGDYVAEVEHDKHVDGRSGRVSVAGEADAGTVALVGAGSIRGKVKTPDGGLAEASMVTIRSVTGGDAEGRRETALNGAFRVDRLAAGDYELTAAPIVPGGPSDAGPKQIVTVRTGEISRVDLTAGR